MKIVQIMPEFGLAGAETMCENLTNELVGMGHTVAIISMYDYHSPITDRLEKNGIKIHYLGKKNGLDISSIWKLRKLLKLESPDVIHTHRYIIEYAVPASIGLHIKRKIHTVHNIASKELPKSVRKLCRLFYKFLGVTPVALSDIIQDSIVEEYKLNKDKVPVAFNGVPLEKCVIKKSYSLGKTVDVLHVGRFSEQKNHVALVEAAIKVHSIKNNVRFLLVGDGPLKNDISQLIKEKGADGFIIECGKTDNVFQYMQSADIFCLPSKYEGIPMTLIEAMGSGLPIVASRVGGIPDMITDGKEGLLCTPDADDIAIKIEQMIEDDSLREACGKCAFAKSAQFSSKTMAEKYIEIYSRQ